MTSATEVAFLASADVVAFTSGAVETLRLTNGNLAKIAPEKNNKKNIRFDFVL